MRTIFLALLMLCPPAFAFPGFDPFTSAAANGGTSYAPGSALYHQTNAMLEGWSLWNGGSGSFSAEVMCVASNFTYPNFPQGLVARKRGTKITLPLDRHAAKMPL